jgi:outer membrane protein OmpA-like peptidoglycan-associated protein
VHVYVGMKLGQVLLISALATAGACSGQVAFQGTTPIAVSAAPPAAPPPPPPVAVAPPRVEVRDNKIEIHEKIQFDYDKATIKPASNSLLDEIVDVIKKNPQIKKIEVQGHASSDGEPKHNRTLSGQRAQAVMAYLSSHGIATGELVSKGFGADKPIGDNATSEGREANRRVEFLILEQDVTHKQVSVDAKGVETVVKEDHETVKADGGGTP